MKWQLKCRILPAFKEESLILKLFYRIEIDWTLPTMFFDTTVILIPKPYKDSTKRTSDQFLFWTLMQKFSIKKFANQIQEHIKNIMHHGLVGYIPGLHVWFNIGKSFNLIYHVNKWKEKSHILKRLWHGKTIREKRKTRHVSKHNKSKSLHVDNHRQIKWTEIYFNATKMRDKLWLTTIFLYKQYSK
jgi:hypothetical protein